jgi:hypothetical protein
VTRLEQLVLCLEERADAAAEAFVLRCFGHAAAFAAIKSDPSGSDLNELVAHVLSRDTPKMQQQLVAAHKTLTGGMLPPAIVAARATMTSQEFFQEFSPWLKGLAAKRSKKTAADHERVTFLLAALGSSEDDRYLYRHWMGVIRAAPSRAAAPLTELDPRWLDAAVEAQCVELVCQLARPNHAATNQFLSAQLAAAKKPHDGLAVLQTMVRIGHPDAADALIAALKKQAKETTHYYLSYWYGPMIAHLPRSALPKLEELLPTLPEKMVDQLMESVLALKNRSE